MRNALFLLLLVPASAALAATSSTSTAKTMPGMSMSSTAKASTSSASPVMTMGKKVTINLEAGQGGANKGLNFNGGYKGNKTFTVPLGSTVTVKFHDAGMMPHSFVVTKGGPAPKDAEVADAAFKGAYGPAAVEKGIQPGATVSATFTANKAGSYYIVCGMPGHAPAGQYIDLVVSKTAKTASFN